MKSILWISETQVIPGYGVAEFGVTILLPDNLADEFVNREMAIDNVDEEE